jgi:TrmH family RNA methyltransferase
MTKKIESVKNTRVKQWKKLHMKKEREKSGQFLIEGTHLIEEALKCHVTILDLIIAGEQFTIPTSWSVDKIEITIVTKEVMASICDTETPQGVAAVCKRIMWDRQIKLEKLLLLDGVQDPGNVGTMIRTADAAGIDAIIVGDGSVDIYNPKVIRSTQGSIFHIPVFQENLHERFQSLKEQGIPIYGTSLQNGVDYKQASQRSAFALVVGNEGAGVEKALLAKTDQNLYIPIYGQSESLNVAVATGILLYYLRG